ncbi:MAG: hypothetical protein NTW68_03190 [candidate division NC10 bacterium]|nr:hypothetical protein [candidate division NC10 bacterium]
MRSILILSVLIPLMVGCAAQQQAAQTAIPSDAVGKLTSQEAVGQFGKPTYERACEDGSTTLGWKRQASPPQTISPTPQGRFLVLYGPAEGDPKEVLVCKFDQSGRLLWWRETK